MKAFTLLAVMLMLFLPAMGGQEVEIFRKDGSITYKEDQKTDLSRSEEDQELGWSFGITYIPYYSGIIYKSYYQSYVPNSPYLQNYDNEKTMMEGEFSFLISPGWRLIFNVSSTGQHLGDKDKIHYRYTDVSMEDDSSGISELFDLKLYNFSLGIKYFFKGFSVHKVNPYIMAGAGKQIAHYEHKYKLVNQNNDVQFEDNLERFFKNLNSPFRIFIGLGTEYMFNKSLSIFSTIRLDYLSSGGTYKFRKVDEYSTKTRELEYKTSWTTTYVGIGMNFYF